VRIELRNNGGELDGVVMTILFDEACDECCERSLVEWMQLRRRPETVGFRRRAAALPGRGGIAQQIQEN
jgi:hypothetical protein